MTLAARNLNPGFAAELTGIDLRTELQAHVRAELRRLLSEFGVLVFRSQRIQNEDQIRLGRIFGDLARFRTSELGVDYPPEIFYSANFERDGRFLPESSEESAMLKLNWLWHIDTSYRLNPSVGSILRPIEIAESGGETVFADLRSAYGTLTQETQQKLAHLSARHSFEYMIESQHMPPLSATQKLVFAPVIHPLVRQDSRRGSSLFLSPIYMESIVGWSQDRGRDLILELSEWCTQEHFLYRHHWQHDDVVVWDNGWTMHMVVPYALINTKRAMLGSVITSRNGLDPLAKALS